MQAFITAVGSHLPGPVVANGDIDRHIGRIGGRPSAAARHVLERNGIRGRHYLSPEAERGGGTSAAHLAARALADALDGAELDRAAVDYLAAATTQNDLLVPGFASLVHGEAGFGPLEVASFQSVCAGIMMALKSAMLQVKADGKQAAMVVGAESARRFFLPGRLEGTDLIDAKGRPPFDVDFLRYTLSDGAGAALVEPRPNERGLSLRLEWVELRSFADRFPVCMWAGGQRREDGTVEPWSLAASTAAAAQRGDFTLRQDLSLLDAMLPVWVGEYLSVLRRRQLDPQAIDHVLCHYSVEALLHRLWHLLEPTGACVPLERWFTVMPETGNVGTASLFVGMKELLRSGRLKHGDSLLCVVPESGRCIIAFALMTVVDPSRQS